LKDINLNDMIQGLICDFEKSQAIQTVFKYNFREKLISDELKLNIYRTIQEQLNNIAKHAEAKQVAVSIQTDKGFINIIVEDDGKGFDINSKRKGIGISNILNRVESFNGQVTINSSPGNGCKISFEIPLN
jgi:signal transduction histidine kinase